MLRSAQGVVVDAALLTDPGRDPEKQVNEDAVAISETAFGMVAIVCDGMGGHERGELASRTAVERMLEVLRGDGASLERLLSHAFERAHAEVYALGGNAPADARPGSTAVVLLLAGREAIVAHVGDSRGYRIRARQLERLTRDHSVVEALLAAGAITPEKAEQHPDANRITRALGISAEIDPELSAPLHVETGDVFVLCSDGLSDLVSDAEVAELVTNSASPEAACRHLVDVANQRGGHDNISVAVMRVLTVGSPRRSGQTMDVPVAEEPAIKPTFSLGTDEPGTLESPLAPLPATPRATLKGQPDATTVVDNPAFTVVMGTRADVAKTVHYPNGGRPAAPTLVDPMIAGKNPLKTIPGDDRPPPTPAAPPAVISAAPTPPAMPSHHASDTESRPRRTHDRPVHLILLGTAAACGVIVLLILIWWLVR